jgi:hypothetical protein
MKGAAIKAVGIVLLLTGAAWMAVDKVEIRPKWRQMLYKPGETAPTEPVTLTHMLCWGSLGVGAYLVLFSKRYDEPKK